MAPWLIRVCGVLVCALPSAPAAAQCDVIRPNLPDFDQRREPAPGILGLPNNGSAHCVPASWADNLAYLANHGIPGLTLDVIYDWHDASTYNTQSLFIFLLGDLMGTDSGGTSNSVGPLADFFDDRAPGMLVGGAKSWSNGNPATPEQLYEHLLAGGFAAVTRSFYAYEDGETSLTRTGGHIMAARHVFDGCSDHPRIGMRDPNSSDSKFVNSPWGTYSEELELRTYSFFVDGVPEERSYWTWAATTTDEVVKTMTGFSTVMPTVALTEDVIEGTIVFYRPLNLTDEVGPTHGGILPWPPGTGPLAGIHVDPGLGYAWAIASDSAGGSRIIRIGLGSGRMSQRTVPQQVQWSCMAHNGALYAGSGRQLHQYNQDSANLPIYVTTSVTPHTVMAIAEDDRAGSLLFLGSGPSGFMMWRQPLSLVLPPSSPAPLPPATVAIDGRAGMFVHKRTGEVLLCSTGFPILYRLAENSAGAWQILQTISVPGMAPANPHFSDEGTILFTSNGFIYEYQQDTNGNWQRRGNSRYAGRVAGNHFALAVTRPAAEQPDDIDGVGENIADEPVQSNPDRCSPDFDGDGDIGTDADIEAFFACLAGSCCPACPSADYDGDGDVGTDADIEAFFRVLGGGAC
jgi:hypothetical protein